MSEVRFKSKGMYAHSSPLYPHLEVSEDGQVVDVNEDMAAQCLEYGWAEPVEGGSEAEPEDKKQVAVPEDKMEKKKKKKKSLAERLANGG